MHLSTAAGFVSVLLWALLASAASVGLDTRMGTVRLVGRQSSNLPTVPSSCSETCAIFNTLNTFTDASQLCTQATSQGLQTCANCVLLIGGNRVLNNDTLLSQTQRSVNSFVSACNAASLPIPNVFISNPVTRNGTETGSGQSSPSRNSRAQTHVGSLSALFLAGLGLFISLA